MKKQREGDRQQLKTPKIPKKPTVAQLQQELADLQSVNKHSQLKCINNCVIYLPDSLTSYLVKLQCFKKLAALVYTWLSTSENRFDLQFKSLLEGRSSILPTRSLGFLLLESLNVLLQAFVF